MFARHPRARTRAVRPQGSPWQWFLALLSLSALAACGNGEIKYPGLSSFDASVQDELDAGPSPCVKKKDGTLCGPDMHCAGQVCLPNSCGDGVVQGDEQCDDGNQIDRDGCSPSCRIELPTCGDAVLDPGEECDDGNSINTDACSNQCTLNVCGNHRRDPGEECDGGPQGDDFCTNQCKRVLCGNGKLDPGEECDDGNQVDTDGCTNDCKKMKCGDGVVNSGPPLNEECDDANQIDDDACSNQCTANVCGNSRVDPGELCDGNACGDGGHGICNATCDGCQTDFCNQCLKDKCTVYGSTDPSDPGLDVYTACLDDASKVPVLIGGTAPSATFTQDCTALFSCARFNHCDSNPIAASGFAACACSDVPVPTSLALCQTLGGPCLGPLVQATECTKAAQEDLGSCIENAAQDLTRASGYAFFMFDCMQTQCPSECGNQ